MNCIHFVQIHASDNLLCHENTNRPLDGTYLTDLGIDIKLGGNSNNSDVFYFNQNVQILGGFDFMNFQLFLNVGSLTIKVHFLKHFKSHHNVHILFV